MNIKKCCFIGHRKINLTDNLKQKVFTCTENLILNENIKVFLFGSRSEFNTLCHEIVEKMKYKYPDIKLVSYDCKNEKSFMESERQKWEDIYSRRKKQKVHLLCVDEIIEFKSKYTAGKASYIERNQAMIDESDYCLFYYDENYMPPKRKQSKDSFISFQPNSGTSLAYKYATQKKKVIFNLL